MGLSRNKVAVPEGAAGSPPFYGEFQSNVFWTVCAARMPTVGVVSVVAGVEEIVGLPFPWGMAGVVRVCFWVPGPPPHRVSCGAVPMPMRSSRRPLDAWWNVWRVAV